MVPAAASAARMTPQAMQWLIRFERYLATERRLSDHTVQAYRHDLRALQHWCERTGLTDWVALDHQHVRSFFGFLMREGALAHNPALEVRAPKATRRLPLTLDVDQMAHLLTMRPKNALETRDLALMELLYSSGLRLAELISLTVADMDLESGQVRVHGWRCVPAPPRRIRPRSSSAGAGRRWGHGRCSCGWRRTRVPWVGHASISTTQSIPILIFSTWSAHMIKHTRVPNAANKPTQ